MERLEIENFLCIKKAELEIKRFNVIIGPQASGKSVLAKLAFFFKEIFKIQFQESILRRESESEFVRNCKLKFEEIFPPYAWRKTFNVVYRRGKNDSINDNNNIWVSITYEHDTDNLDLKYSPEFSEFYNSQIKRIQTEIDHPDESNQMDREFSSYVSFLIDARNSFRDYFDLDNVFIPATRSIIALMQKNMFSLMPNKVKIDPFLESFGIEYDSLKKKYGSKTTYELLKALHDEMSPLVNEVIGGKYEHKDGDWIVNGDTKTKLEDASSGQQEAVPMLVYLSVYPHVDISEGITYFIEEPESHLFPKAQKQIVSILATLYNLCESNYFITTHSPYILTAINNLITAEQAYSTGKNNQRVEELVPMNQHLSYDDIAAYTIKDGVLCSIMDEENKIIGPSIIDDVSDEFDSTFDGLLDVLYEGK